VEPAPVALADPAPESERDVDENHEVAREDAQRGWKRPVVDEAGHDEREGVHLDRRIEDERDAVEGEKAEPEQREEPVQADAVAGRSRVPSGFDFTTRPATTESVRRCRP